MQSPSIEPSAFLLIQLRKIQSNLRSYSSDTQRLINKALPVLNRKVHVLAIGLHNILAEADGEVYRANNENRYNASTVYQQYENLRTRLLSHVQQKIDRLQESDFINNVWLKTISSESNIIERQKYFSVYSQAQDFLWLTRTIVECSLSQSALQLDLEEKMSSLKSQFLDGLKRVELPSDRQQAITALVSNIELDQLSKAELGPKIVDELERFVRGTDIFPSEREASKL